MKADLLSSPCAVDVDTIDRTVSACSWLLDVAEAAAAAGDDDAVAAVRWLAACGSRLHLVRLSRKAQCSELWPSFEGRVQ